MTTFTTMTEATDYVKAALGEFAGCYDAEAIAREVTDWQGGKLVLTDDEGVFWEAVQAHDESE